MSRQRPGRQVYTPYRAAIKQHKKKSSAVKWLVWSALSLLATGGVIFVISLTVAAMNKTLVAFDNVPGAMNDNALKVLARELNMGNNTELQIVVPIGYKDAIDVLDFRPRETSLEPFDQKRKRIAAEWLFGRKIDESFHKPIAQSVADAFHASNSTFDRELQLSLMRAFQRWGHDDFVHQFMSPTANDKVVPDMLELAQLYPTVAGMEVAATFLKGKYGDVAERIVKTSENRNAKLLVPYYDSGDVTVADRAKRIFEAWDVDPTNARLDYYLAEAAGGDDDAWQLIANIPVKKERRADVIDALRRYKRSRMGVDNWLDACLEWGDASILPMVQEVYVGNWSFDKKKAMQVMVKFPDESSVDVLVDALLNSWASESKQIGRALMELDKAGLDIDYAERVHKPLVRRYNDFGMFQKPAMKTLLETTSFDYNLLVDQCLKDLRLSDESSQAFETLGKMEVIEDRRYEVASVIQEVIQAGGIPGFNTQQCFLHWATPENSMIYDMLEEDTFGGDDWKRALRIALQGEDHIQKIIVPVARAMSDHFKGDQVKQVLRDAGSDAEPLMIFMLKSDNPDEIMGAVTILQSVGTKKCLPDLERVIRIADRKGFADIYHAAVLARTVVKGKDSDDNLYEDEPVDPDKEVAEGDDGRP